jgi:hypothetical protein
MSATREESAIAAANHAEAVPEAGSSATMTATGGTARSVAPEAHAIAGPTLCANCGAPVASHYCGECGQRVEHAVHSVWHFILEAAEDLTHADSRLWRTMLALLFKPGYLTAEFLAGRRMRHLPPLRLYLVLSVMFFLLTGLLDRHPGIWIVKLNEGNDIAVEPAPKAIARPGESAQQVGERLCAQVNFRGPGSDRLLPAFRHACKKSVEDGGRGIMEVFAHNIPRAIFIALPILALVMLPLYRRPRRYYIEHLLFFLHAHAFLFLLLALFAIAATVLQIDLLVAVLALAVAVSIPYYYFIAMRRVYGESRGRTLGKLVVLSVAYLVTGLLILIATSVYSVLAQ